MARPGTIVKTRETPPPRSTPTDTGVWFAVGLSEKGKAEAILISSLTEFESKFGSRVSYGLLYDSAEAFFREGGSQMYISRVLGPSALKASVMLLDGGAANTLLVEAISEGDWGNSLNVQVSLGTLGGTFVLTITHDTLGTLEVSPDLADKTEALAWAQYSDYIKLTDQVSVNDPAVGGPFSLSAGTDDRSNITDVHWKTALDMFSKSLGPGQVSMPGRTTSTAYTDILQHAYDNNRVGILDAPDTATVATLKTSAANARAGGEGRHGAMFAPWVKIQGLTAGTLRTLPPSPSVAGIIARNDVIYSANVPSAGDLGVSVYSLALSQAAWSDVNREDLNDDGINVILEKFGTIRVYGWRSLTNPTTDPLWIPFGNSRLYMEIAALADEIAESYVFDVIDGAGLKTNEFGGALKGMLMPFWVDGSLYGINPDDAFYVDVGPQVNTPETIADNELRAVIAVRMSPMAELVTIEIVKRSVTEAVV
jgi:hypothetical protein